MKANLHPKWYDQANVTCACGNTFATGATVPELHVEICYACHPFYTGQMKYVDTAGRVEAFKSRQANAKIKRVSKTEKRKIKKMKKIQEELDRPESLSVLRTQSKK